MRIAFKEKNGGGQFYRDETGKWIPCDEEKIHALWLVWVVGEGVTRYTDEEGYLVFDWEAQP